ncbi:DUF3455 domain-containing protein [Couchioplanes azureus]|uniref:DUF3455 domain-containing protein n=1 Tax=Couchioplanes caeruleus TaxID=56438 RepID=UPI0019B7865A|nr:DUF3455 domain-containing protein [Couchioplanes caeruleus]GGQ75181.1 hypothetical protein GCM10010166_51410 [Couchioplanes caeruleus subsp. azureus]
MLRTPRRTAILGGAAVAVLGAVTAVSVQASAAEQALPRPRPSVSATPSPITPPPGVRRIGAYRVISGTQTYTCNAGGAFAGPSVPEAMLAGTGGRVHHFAGPSWQSERDGSLVKAAKVGELPRPGTIPELLLEVTSHAGPADGILADAAYIQRLSTSGGVAPARACTPGETVAVPYGARYVFWG